MKPVDVYKLFNLTVEDLDMLKSANGWCNVEIKYKTSGFKYNFSSKYEKSNQFESPNGQLSAILKLYQNMNCGLIICVEPDPDVHDKFRIIIVVSADYKYVYETFIYGPLISEIENYRELLNSAGENEELSSKLNLINGILKNVKISKYKQQKILEKIDKYQLTELKMLIENKNLCETSEILFID